MTFLRPLFLWWLPLVGLPLFLHFWGRRRADTVLFSNLTVLQEALPPRLSPVVLRRWFLLAVRTLLIAVIVVSLARPVFKGVLGSTGQRAVVVLDASYSMGTTQWGQTAFDRARTLARFLIDNRRKGDAWGLVIFSDRVEHSVPVSNDVRDLLSALHSAAPTYRGTRYSAGLDHARSLLGEKGTVVVLSDMALHGGPVRFSQTGGDFFIAAVPVADPLSNGAATGLEASSPGGPWRVIVRRWADSSARSWSLREKGRSAARGFVSWDRDHGVAHVPFVKGPAEFSLDNDSLSADDRWFHVPLQSSPKSVFVVNGAPGLSPVADETYYVRPVLNRLRNEGQAVENVSVDDLPAKLRRGDLKSSGSVVLMLNPPPLSAALVDELTSFVQQGGGLWVTAGDRGGWRSLQNLLPLLDCETVEGNENMRFVGETHFSALSGFAWETCSVDRAVTGGLRPDSSAILETRVSRRPLLSVRPLGAGRVGFWGSSIDRDWTSFPARAAYPILVSEMVRWSSEEKNTHTSPNLFVGDVFFQSGSEKNQLTLIRPDGKKGSFVWADGRWRYDETDLPGFYEAQENPDLRFAVNVRSEREGDPRRFSNAEFESGLASASGQMMPAKGNTAEDLLAVLQGRDVTALLTKIILILAALETLALLFYRRGRS